MLFVISAIWLSGHWANAQTQSECEPTAIAQLTQLESKANGFSQKVQSYKKEWPTVPQFTPGKPDANAIKFCLGGAPQKAGGIYQEGFSVFDELKAFKGSQRGPCAEAAQKALDDMDRVSDDLEAYMKVKCSGG